MAHTYKDPAQSKPSAATLTTLLTVPAATAAVISSIAVCNLSGTPTSFRIAISPGGAAIDDKHYLYHDHQIDGHDTFAVSLGLSLGAGTVVRVYATDATLSFNASFVEIT